MERKLTAIATSTATTTTTKWWQQRQRKQNNIHLCERMAIREGKMLEIRMEWDWREKFVELYQNVDLHAYVSYRSMYSMSDLGIRTHTHARALVHTETYAERDRPKEREKEQEKDADRKNWTNIRTSLAHTHTYSNAHSCLYVRMYVLELLPSTRSFCTVWYVQC